jgi:hypothetical protein
MGDQKSSVSVHATSKGNSLRMCDTPSRILYKQCIAHVRWDVHLHQAYHHAASTRVHNVPQRHSPVAQDSGT